VLVIITTLLILGSIEKNSKIPGIAFIFSILYLIRIASDLFSTRMRYPAGSEANALFVQYILTHIPVIIIAILITAVSYFFYQKTKIQQINFLSQDKLVLFKTIYVICTVPFLFVVFSFLTLLFTESGVGMYFAFAAPIVLPIFIALGVVASFSLKKIVSFEVFLILFPLLYIFPILFAVVGLMQIQSVSKMFEEESFNTASSRKFVITI